MIRSVRKREPLPPADERRLRRAAARAEEAERALDELLAEFVDRGLATSAAEVLEITRQGVYARVNRFRER